MAVVAAAAISRGGAFLEGGHWGGWERAVGVMAAGRGRFPPLGALAWRRGGVAVHERLSPLRPYMVAPHQ